MSGERRRLIIGERATLDPFIALPDDGVSPRDQRDLMERPFFSLAKSNGEKASRRPHQAARRRGGAP
jgi:plasmid replication initiation protein